jgi:hypothetical protein
VKTAGKSGAGSHFGWRAAVSGVSAVAPLHTNTMESSPIADFQSQTRVRTCQFSTSRFAFRKCRYSEAIETGAPEDNLMKHGAVTQVS